MTRTTSWLAILACAIALSGCSTVYSTRPLGLPVWSEMQGTWEVGGRVVEIELLPDGSMSIARMYWDEDEKQFTLGKFELVISVDEGATYANIRDPDAPEGSEQYLFYRVLFLGASTTGAGPDLVLIAPEYDFFSEAVREGILRGESGNMDTVVDGSQLPDFVDPRRFVEQFEVDNRESTILARRIVTADGPDIEGTVLHQGRQAHMKCLPEALPQRVAAKVHRSLRSLQFSLNHDLAEQLEQQVELPEPAAAQWARFLNVDPERWAKVMAPMPTSERWFSIDKNDIAIHASLSAADFSTYLTCLDVRGFGLVNVSFDLAKPGYGRFWVAKSGFGLFEFGVRLN